MKSFIKILTLVCLFSVVSAFAKGEVVGYFQTSVASGMPNTTVLDNLTHVILFQVYPNADGSALDTRWFITTGLSAFVTAAHNKNVKVIVAVGGSGGGTANFPGATDTPTKRANFANALKNLVNQYNLDGVDLDWEPLQPVSAQTWQNYLDLLLAFKTAMPDKRISATLGADSPIKSDVSPLYGNHFPNDPGVVANFKRDIWKIDAVQLMTYDMCTGGCVPGWSGSGANASSSQKVIDNWATFGQGQTGFSKEKIFIGVHSIQDDQTSAKQKISSAYQGGYGGAILWEFRNNDNNHLTWIADETRRINGGKLGGSGTNPSLYTVTFNANGGSVSPTSTTQASQGGSVTLPTPTRSGYDFNGWFTAATGGTKINGSTYTPTGNITIYAQWTQKPATRHAVPGNINACEYSAISSLTNVNGEKEQCEGINIGYLSNNSYVEYLLDVGGAGDYKISMETAQGSNTARTVTIKNGNSSLGTISVPAGSNWTTYTKRETNITLPNGNMTLTISVNGDVNFQKIVIEKVVVPTYTVTFNSNGGTAVTTQNITSGSTATKPANPTRTGYTFENWYSNTQLTTLFNFTTVITANTTLYAKWTPVTYTITYTLNSGTNNAANPANYTIESNDITLQNPTRTGYVFDGWYENSSFTGSKITTISKGSIGNKTFYAKWIQTYTVTFNTNGGNTISNQTVNSGSTATKPTDPTRNGYTFENWYSNTQLTTLFNFTTVITANGTLYAKWTPVTYTITYTLNNGTNNAANPTSYTIESNSITLQAPTRSGYTFTGWTGSNGTTGQTNVTIAKGSTGNKNYTANWTVISPTTYTITASVSGGNGSISPSGESVYAENSTPKYTFTSDNGYEIDEVLVNGKAVDIDGNSYTFDKVTANQTISVSFKEIPVIVDTYKLVVNNGYVVDSDSFGDYDFNEGDTITLVAAIPPSTGLYGGYVFSHWEFTPSVQFVKDTDENSEMVTFVMPAKDVVAEAVTEYVGNTELIFSVAAEHGVLSVVNADNPDEIINSDDEVISGNYIFTAIPDEGYRVKEWKVNGEVVTGNSSNTLELFVYGSTMEIIVEFELDSETAIQNKEKPDNKILFKSNIVSDKMEINLSGKISFVVYDMTGNFVATGNDKTWNLQNQNGRFVANGTYLVIVEEKTANGKTYQYFAKLGVKR